MRYRLTRYYPQQIEIEVLSTQIVSMFPVEIQSHPVFGELKRVWKTSDSEYSVECFSQEDVQIVNPGHHMKLKDEVMLRLLQNLEKFQIVLYYSDKQDIYDVVRI